MPSLNETPSSDRISIAIYGKRNAGKSALINTLTNQDIAIVSDTPGTTADPVKKAMEIRGVGACMLIDTAGFDDEGDIGKLRVEKTAETMAKADIALLLFSDKDITAEEIWSKRLTENRVKQIAVISKSDITDTKEIAEEIKSRLNMTPVIVSAKTRQGIDELLEKIAQAVPEEKGNDSILGGLAGYGDTVLLVMPQDSEAPKGRLILPQVQTIRELLDTGCVSINATPQTMENAINSLKKPPKLIITDSQAFKEVYEKKPKESMLTSFSVLFAAHKGDINAFVEGAKAIDSLNEGSRVLIAEACTHAPLTEDIGRVKIPALMRKRFGEKIKIDIASGRVFPENLEEYDIIVHCGGCMFNRKYLLSRIEAAKNAGVPITNYGVLIAKLKGILDYITLPNQKEF